MSRSNQTRLQEALRGNTVLQSVVLDKCKFSDAGVSKLLTSILQNKTISSLILRDSELSEAVIPDLCYFLTKTQVELERTGAVSGDLVPEVLEFLGSNELMTDLQLTRSQLTDTGFSRLLKALSENTALRALVIGESVLTDAGVPDLCKFLQANKLMRELRFEEAQFTDSGLAQILLSLSENTVLTALVTGQSKLTDAVVADICHFLQVNKVMQCLHLSAAVFTDAGFSGLLQFFHQPTSVQLVFVTDRIDDRCVQPLVKFMQLRTDLTGLRSVDGGQAPCLEITRREHDPSFYYIMTGEGPVQLLTPPECLQATLSDFLTEKNIPSAVEVMTQQLVLFVQREEKQQFQHALKEKIQTVHVNFAKACKLQLLDSPFVIEDHTKICSPGSRVVFTDDNGGRFASSLGAIFKDEHNALYILSTFHGKPAKRIQVCDIDCNMEAEVYQPDPMLDACLINIPQTLGITPALPVPHTKAALCGPYTDPILRTEYVPSLSSDPSDMRCFVQKHGDKTALTTGFIKYTSVKTPSCDKALGIEGLNGAFSEGGDSGAVIFTYTQCIVQHTDQAQCHIAIAVVKGAAAGFTLAFRLDEVTLHFEKQLGNKLHLCTSPRPGTDNCRTCSIA